LDDEPANSFRTAALAEMDSMNANILIITLSKNKRMYIDVERWQVKQMPPDLKTISCLN
jgi:hypothetical protein